MLIGLEFFEFCLDLDFLSLSADYDADNVTDLAFSDESDEFVAVVNLGSVD